MSVVATGGEEEEEEEEAVVVMATPYAQRKKEHAALHAKYKPDDNATDRAIAIARRNNPAADHAAEAVVIYDLHRTGAFELAWLGGDGAR